MMAHKRRHTQMILKTDQGSQGPGWKDTEIANAFDCYITTVENLRERPVEQGLKPASS